MIFSRSGEERVKNQLLPHAINLSLTVAACHKIDLVNISGLGLGKGGCKK